LRQIFSQPVDFVDNDGLSFKSVDIADNQAVMFRIQFYDIKDAYVSANAETSTLADGIMY